MPKRYDPDYLIQEFRATLNRGALEKEIVFSFSFPYHQTLEHFLDAIAAQRGKKLQRNELYPWRSLNTLLMAAISSLVHPFRKMGKEKDGRPAQRHLLVLEHHPRPTREQLLSLIIPWIRDWVEYTFKDDILLPAGADAYQGLLDSLGYPETDWESLSIGTILEQEDHPFLYTAVPSVLAARLAGQTCNLSGNEIPVQWRLVQQAEKHLALTSDPINVSYTTSWGKEIKGHFVYLVEFLPHHEPGTPLNHFIHLRIACRRYAEKTTMKLLGKRSASILIGIHQPRILDPQATWPALPILVPLPVRQSKNGKYYWGNRLARLLKAFQASEQVRGSTERTLRPLESPTMVCRNPKNAWITQLKRKKDDDECYLLFAEGIKPAHTIKTGFSPRELYEVWNAIMQLSGDMLTSVPPIEGMAEMAHLSKGRVLSMIPFWKLHEEKTENEITKITNTQVLTPFQEELPGGKKTLILRPKDKQVRCLEALERVFSEKRIGLIFCYLTSTLCDKVQNAVEHCYLSSRLVLKPERLQNDILVTPLPSPGDEIDEDDPDATGNQFARKQRQYQQWKLAYQDCKDAWQPILEQAIARVRAEGLVPAVMVEIPRTAWERLSAQQNPKHIVRDLCAELGVGSQMIQSLMNNESEGSWRGRVENALADLLVRQNGLIIGDICELYRWAGVPTTLAKDLTVVGLYRCRSTDHHVDFPLAVRILPTGRIEMQFPTSGHSTWQSYERAQFSLGRLFVETTRLRQQKKKSEANETDPLYLEDRRIEQFVERICTNGAGPTLILLEASDFRSVWLQLQNQAMAQHQNTLAFSDAPHSFDRTRLQNLWVVRLREAGSSCETPQYVRLAKERETGDEQSLFASGLFFLSTAGDLPIYHSIGRTPSTDKQRHDTLKIAEGSTEAFKHSHILEIIPFFRSPAIGDDALARISHALRFTPSWEMGSTILPLPNHLGRKAVADYLWVLPEK